MEREKKAYQVIVDPVASDRMAEHFEFLAHVSVPAANRLLAELLKDVRSLKTLPYRHPPYIRPYLPPEKYRYMISGGRYRIIYQVDGDFVFVDDIQDCRQDEDKSILHP
jgi:mRNA-degrading endonuclease RelE of RelBE toxin-antitoxin system